VHELLTLGELEFGVFVVGLSFDDGLEVSEGIAGVEDGCVGDGTPPVCLSTSVYLVRGASRMAAV
jgi:hypothetical protein